MNHQEILNLRKQGVPDPDGTPLGNLRHTVAVCWDTPDSVWVIDATVNIYANYRRTGLTMGDLRALLAQLEG